MLKESTLLLFFLTIIIGISFIFGITVPCGQTYQAENGKLCYPCGAGYYKVSDCVKNGEQARCRPCGNGEYQPYCDNSIKCEICVSCFDPRQVKIKNCTTTSNTECQCKAGFFWKSYTWMYEESHCIEHSKCKAGEGLVEKGTPFEDTKCEPCREGVSYSDNSSFDSCTTCTVCSTTVVYKCTAIQDTVCSDQVPQRPTQTKNSSKRLGEGAIAGIVCFVILIGAVFVVVYSIYRYRRNNTLNSDIESHKVAISNTNDADGENDISKAQSDAIAIETETTPEDTKSANKSYHSDESEEGSVKSYTNSQQRQEHAFENDAFDSRSCTASKTQKESENNAIECEQEAKSYPSPQTTIVNDNDPNNHFGVNGLQTDSTESSDENLKEEDAKGQKQFPGKPKQSEYELKNTDSSQSCNKHDLPTDPVKHNDTPFEGKITSGNEKIKDDQLRFNNGKDTDVSKDVAAVSPRDSLHCGGSNREGVAEESMISAVSRQNNTLNSAIEPHKVALSNTNADGENGISKAQSDDVIIITTETPEDTKSANEINHSDESKEGSVKSYTYSQQSQEHVFENDAFDSLSRNESKTQKESENNAIEDEQEAKCYPLPQTTIVNDNNPNTNLGVYGIQTDSTESSDENLKEEDAKGQKQFPGKPKQSEYELKNTGSSQSCNKNVLPTDPVKNNDTPFEGKITSGNEKIKDDQLRINNGKDTDVSKDVAAVSPRDSLHCGGSNREGVAEESMICAVSKQNNILNSDIESHKVALSNTNTNGENGISKAQSEDVIVITTEIPENIQSANKSSHFDESEEGSVKSYTYSQQSQEHVFENDAFDSLSCTELKTQKESEYNVIEDEQEAKCYPSPLTILVNGNDPNTHLGVSGIQTDSTESSDENLKEEDANEQIQFLGKTSLCNNNDLPTDLVTNIDTSLEGKTTSANEKIKDDQLRVNNCEDTDVSLDAAAVSPRDSLHCVGPNREDVTEESMTEETGSGIQSQTGGNSKGNRAEKTVRSNDCISKEIVWYEIKTFLSLNLKSSEFHSFIMELVAKTNGGLLRTIDVVINHAKEENKTVKDTIYSVMNKWRQATPEATVRCVYDALKECSLNLKCEELEETLEQKGLLERINSSFQYMTGHNEETGQKHYLPPDECSAQSRREINHEIDELKE